MSNIRVKPKPRKDPGSALYTNKDSSKVWVGRDYALQNEIEETKAKTRERGCFKGCRTCGACANSRRDNLTPQAIALEDGTWRVKGPQMSYDSKAQRWVNCRECEPFRFHDCQNGVLRTTDQEAEPFTTDMYELMRKYDGKPLI